MKPKTEWQPDQYNRFAAERRQPFDELTDLCRPVPDGLVYDFGCGPGTLTAELVDRLQAQMVTGVDTSEAMLERAASLAHTRLEFVQGDIDTFEPPKPADIILSNAALHWLDDHDAVIARWRQFLSPGGQLAIQVPANLDHPVYRIAAELADDVSDWFRNGPPPPVVASVHPPEHYAQLLHDLGGMNIHVGLRVYPHILESTSETVEWIKGTSLLRYKKALSAKNYDQFEATFRDRVLDELGHHEPYLFTFKRILMWARFPDS